MGKLEATLKLEISRLAKKETKAALQPLNEKLKKLSQKIKVLEQENAKLRKAVDKPATKATTTPNKKAEANNTPDDKRKVRFSANMLKKFRAKANLTQGQMAKLLSVSMGAIVNWEKGASSPRMDSRVEFAALRQMSASELKAKMKELGISGRKRKVSK